jgi:hypothetical protein
MKSPDRITKRQYDAIIKFLDRACHEMEKVLGAGAGSAFVANSGRKPSRLAPADRIYKGLFNLLEEARKARSRFPD